MLFLDKVINILEKINLAFARAGRSVAWILVAAMVLSILLQVF